MRIVKSKRKTVSIQILSDGNLLVRAPNRMADNLIESYVESKRKWIEKKRTQILSQHERIMSVPVLSSEEKKDLLKKAKEVFLQRAEYYSKIIGVRYGKITVRFQKTRWGSCSSKGNLNFNCMLMFAPIEVIDSVIVHELCHLMFMNHSGQFYGEVRRVYPEYDMWNKWLKENGPDIMARIRSI